MKPYYFIEVIDVRYGISTIWPFSFSKQKDIESITFPQKNIRIVIRKINKQGIFIIKEWSQ